MQAADGFDDIAEIDLADRRRAFVYEHGWQSWSPTGRYPVDLARSPRPTRGLWQSMAFRPGRPGPDTGFQGEGLLVVEPGDGSARTWLASRTSTFVPIIRARLDGQRLIVSADGPVEERPVSPGLGPALTAAADALASTTIGARPVRPLGPGWCSWYGYWH